MRVYFGKTDGTIIPRGGGSKKYVIWGDWLDVEDNPDNPREYIVNWKTLRGRARTVSTEQYLVKKEDCQDEPLLEMIFLDVGQGDGCIANVPSGNRHRTLLVDAGQRANMHGFLNWRFRNLDDDGKLYAAVITHPDADHYQGFQRIFDDERISFEHVFHNGLVDRTAQPSEERIGPRSKGACTQVFPTRARLNDFLDAHEGDVKGNYPTLLRTALRRFADVSMASTEQGEMAGGRRYLPGFAPTAGDGPSIEILGPVPERNSRGQLVLRGFGDKPHDGRFDAGKTKNGHSVILRLEYRDFSVIFGGDLNRPSEDYLLRHYGEIAEDEPLKKAVKNAKARLAADFLKCCHHGSADVTDEFLQAVYPFGFVVSSGDQESHVHPRPEILGLLGKSGRGDRPLVLCTEILRSTPESKVLSKGEKLIYKALIEALDAAVDVKARKAARKKIDEFWNRRFERLVNVYGAINVRTDGRRLIVAFRKEKASRGSPWQLYEYAIKKGEWQGVELKKARP